MGEGSWPPAPHGRTGALASSAAPQLGKEGVKGVVVGGILLQRGRLELVLRPLPPHCSWAQKGSLDVAVPPLAPGVCSGSLLSLLAQVPEVAGFSAVGRRCF